MSLSKSEIYSQHVSDVSKFLDVVEFLKPLFTKKTCVLLKGDLAAGKTTLVQYFCSAYLLKQVSSPTFALHHVYSDAAVSSMSVDHFDLYRLQTADEIETSGVWDVLAKSQGLVFIEWSERISDSELPADWTLFEIQINVAENNQRFVKISELSLG